MKKISVYDSFIELNEKLRNQLNNLTTKDTSFFDDISLCTKAIHYLRKAGNAKYPEENYPLIENLLIKINKSENINFSEIIVILNSILNLRELPEIAI